MSVFIGTDGPAYRSYTSLSGYLQCQKAWQLSRLAGVPEKPAFWLAGGKAVHAGIERYDLALFEAEGR